jgi:Tfp pilus assembly protein PilF
VKELLHRAFLPFIISIGIVVLTIGAYAPVLGADFINYDDPDYVIDNPHVRAGLSWRGILWALTTGHAGNWHPLTWLSHMLDVSLFGLQPGWHHLTNVLSHCANSVLLFLMLRHIAGGIWRSAVTAALFAFHPMHVESVAWISERKDVLSTMFGFLAIWAYACYARRRAAPGSQVSEGSTVILTRRFYGLALLSFALALLSKPMWVTLPFLLLLLDYWPLKRLNLFGQTMERPTPRIAPLIYEKLPFCLLSVISSIVTFLVQKKGGAVSPFDLLPFSYRVINAIVAYAAYIKKLLWPSDLAVFYRHPGLWPIDVVVFSALLLIAVSAVVVVTGRRHPCVAVGWCWFLGTLVPVIGLVQVGDQYMADRYSYLPSVGFFLLIVWTVAAAAERWKQLHSAVLLAAMALCACWITARVQSSLWRNSLTLFEHAARVTPDNYVALNNVGFFLTSQERFEEAETYLLRALESKPTSGEAWNNHANIQHRRGQLDQAQTSYQKARKNNPQDPQPENNLANLLIQSGQRDEALIHVRRALQLNPNLAQAHYNLANIHVLNGDLAQGIRSYEKALELKRDYPQAHYNLAVVLRSTGQMDGAEQHFREASRMQGEAAADAEILK